MRPVSGLTVIGCPYCYNAWDVEAADGVPVFHSKIKQLKHREIDAYTDSGVFQTMGVPVFIEEDVYKRQLLDVVVIVAWTFVFQWIYGRIFPPRRMLYVHGNRSTSYLRDKINSREDKYQICRNLDYRCGMERLFKEIDKYDAVIIDDIPSHERNRLIKECYNRSIRTYSAPKISDILIRSSGEMNLFDSPLLLSKNDGLQIEQKIVKRLLDLSLIHIYFGWED